MDGEMDGCAYGWKISPFYRTLSPIGAAAQKTTQLWKRYQLLGTISQYQILTDLKKTSDIESQKMFLQLETLHDSVAHLEVEI